MSSLPPCPFAGLIVSPRMLEHMTRHLCSNGDQCRCRIVLPTREEQEAFFAEDALLPPEEDA